LVLDGDEVFAGLPVAATPGRNEFTSQASTTVDLPASQVAAEDGLRATTFADAVPQDGAMFVAASFGNDEQSFKLLADEVKLTGHREPILSGVAPRAVFSSAEAFSCLNYTTRKG